MNAKLKGPWSEQQIADFFAESVFPLRLAAVAPDGFPVVASLWYLLQGDTLHCVSHQDSRLIGLLRDNDRVGFELAPNEPPYHGVRGQGIATLSPLGERDTLEKLLVRYLGDTNSTLAQWLLSRQAEEILIAIKPSRLFSWDYRQRMEDVAT
ncbi:pyridoxamine 5'-phosphate oxidase family protein [Parahaliea aestuarii]|uniref:Pyridoxamine 5'-phosphate oxidase family protein n=1 Tax=Parahaliea aestuarii TaxID=1852021 RepID=A0A5C8ZVZ5_9GAMM|nr:pyridoxamine 5'-phosphate oxidase family protein [Parahaliea aestuarii]TXS91637.1 pyridoxamine 5'-phosphate oxidase family protein [Parahaliea aestuarii]